jgi:flagellar hook assembly protein FlgD
MLPILALVGVSVLSTLAGKVVTSLIERSLAGGAATNAGKAFDAVLEWSQATQSGRTDAKISDGIPRTSSTSTISHGPGKDASLGLLVAQLRAQRSLTGLSGALPAVGGSSRGTLASGYIGRKVVANGSVIDLRGPVPSILRYLLPRAAASVQVEVQDLQGNVIRTVQLGAQPGGLHQLPFDGRGLQSGLYVYKVIAADVQGLPLVGISTATGRVTEVRFEGGRPFLVVGGALVPVAGVYEVGSHASA